MEGLGPSLVATNDSALQTTISAIVLVVLQPAGAAALRTKFRVFYVEPLPRSNVFWNAVSIERNDLERVLLCGNVSAQAMGFDLIENVPGSKGEPLTMRKPLTCIPVV